MSLQMMVSALSARGVAANPKLVLVCMADHANDDGVCFPSQEVLADRCGEVDARTIRRHIDTLKDLGFVDVLSRHRQTAQRYQLHLPRRDGSCACGDPAHTGPKQDRTDTSGLHDGSFDSLEPVKPEGQDRTETPDLQAPGTESRPDGYVLQDRTDTSSETGRIRPISIGNSQETVREPREPSLRSGSVAGPDFDDDGTPSKAYRDAVWDCLVELFGKPPPSQESLFGRVAAYLVNELATVGEIRRRTAALKLEWSNRGESRRFSVAALEKWWSSFDGQVGQATAADVERARGMLTQEEWVAEIDQLMPDPPAIESGGGS